MRFGAVFIVVCMAIIAASAGAVAYLYLGFAKMQAATVAVATFTALALYHTVSTRVGLRSMVGRQLADLSRGGADVARQVAELGRRVAALEGKIETTADHARAVTDPLAGEIVELRSLVKRLVETLEGHQAMLDALAHAPSRPQGVSALPAPAEQVAGAPSEQPAGGSASDRSQEAATAAAGLGVDVAAIRSAIDENRIDLYLQPIVTLPQRKVRHYEATSRLRTAQGETLHASAFIRQAESGGLMPRIDKLVTFRCVQLVRRLVLKNRDIGMFCNLSARTLTDATLFAQLLDFLAANRAIAPSLVLQFSHGAVAAMGPAEHERLAALSARGFRFSMDHVTRLRLDANELANRGFRYIKVHADLLLKAGRPAPPDIHPAELSELLGRFGIELIVDRIGNEKEVIDLLDYEVRYGQGSLFSPPRPVRPEALQADPDAKPSASATAPPGTVAPLARGATVSG